MKISKAITNATAPSERLLHPDLSSVSERLINEKIPANNKFNNNINIIKLLEIITKLKLITIIRSLVDMKIFST